MNEQKAINKDHDNDEQVTHHKSSKIIYICKAILTVLYLSYLAINDDIYSRIPLVMILITSFIIGTMIYFIFGYIYKYDKFHIIPGYNKKVEYNTYTLKSMLANIELNIMITSMLFSVIHIMTTNINASNIIRSPLVLSYAFSILSGNIFYNYKYRDKLFKKEKDKIRAKNTGFIVTVSLISISLLVMDNTLSLIYLELENNRIPIMQILLMLLPCVTIGTGWIL
ncbi:hypothetical protein Curi_c20390 [Gottschalkia acidurici 9a]|uniref:Uncharacterized protein n=1 Tax=Gottschalkia acidurici (strain ATCC 7906 / DSM 604 / BCRC 14475 / CIP 104303 / KCTC 5404 / NCIMB 10678 / 9a) TaxID=1128398 RepID=K0AZ17_GOTA9|nr:hypothetical protein [Gottschalkia acidurici]AFS79043.1 hypothetical protein Curi_c20390 [Gottschalkia acidurici 9a]